jgi:hypothetical protein
MFLNSKLNDTSHIDLQNYLIMINFEYTLHAMDDQVALIFSGRLQPLIGEGKCDKWDWNTQDTISEMVKHFFHTIGQTMFTSFSIVIKMRHPHGILCNMKMKVSLHDVIRKLIQ